MVTAVPQGSVAAAAALGGLAVVTLLALLLTKELARDSRSPRLRALHKMLNVAIVPLVLAFLIVVAAQILQVLR